MENSNKYKTKEEVEKAYMLNEFPLMEKIYDKDINDYRYIYYFKDKSRVTLLYEILHLPTVDGNKMQLLLQVCKMIDDGEV